MSGETKFEHAVEARDPDAIADALAAEVTFRSPVVYRPYEGREAVATVLRAVARVTEGFEYMQRLEAPDGAVALIFKARVGDREIDGLDLLRLDDDGRVTELTVMVRPLSGITALAEAMAEELRSMGVPVPEGS
jgi:SnoaL-like domain